jgi:hypothetical protein
MAIPSKSEQKILVRLYLKGKKLGIVNCTCHPRDGRKSEIGRSQLQAGLCKKRNPIAK